MIFKRFLTPKGQRGQAPEDQDNLIRIARGNGDTSLRHDACRRICRLPELRELAASDGDAGLREVALARYRNLLCGQDEGAPPLAERLAEMAILDDQRILEQVATNARDSAVRGAAIAKLANPAVLADCALNDGLAANRSTAVDRIEDRQALDQVVKNIGRKDKLVYRIARQKLKDIAEREALPGRIRARCAELCEKLERLGRYENWNQDRAMLDLLDRQWAEIEPDADAQWQARHRELRDRFLSAYEDYRREHQALVVAEEARAALRQERRTLLEDLAACPGLADEAELATRLADIATRWGALATLPEKEQSALEHKYADLSSQASDRLHELAAQRDRNARLRKLADAADKALAQNRPLEHERIRALFEEAKPLLAAAGGDKAIATRFTEARLKLDERLHTQKQQAERRLAQLGERLDELAAAVEAGELKHAEPLYQSILAGLDLVAASGLPRKVYATAAERLHQLAPRVRDLQKWRKWGSDQHRQELCRTVEGLLTVDLPPEALSLRLHDLQMEWKGLDQGGSPVNHPLWDRFHTLCEQVYERCRPYLEEQAAQREANRRKREALCAELEAFLDQVDWERMDWKKAVRAEREMRQGWAAMGQVEGRHRKVLEKRFHNAMKRLDGHLTAERRRNRQLKQDLIARVEALAEAPDLNQAIEETKRLQRQWHTTVAARQKEENRLWQGFRAACDRVFARRREQHEAYVAELEENLKQRQSLCAQVEALAAAGAEPDEIARAMREIEARWQEAEALTVPRQAAGGLNQRWRAACGRLQQHWREREQAKSREHLDLLARQAAICEGLERALEAGTVADAQTGGAEALWQSLPKQGDAALQAAVEQRFTAALHAAREMDTGAARGRFAANGKRRAEICLRLEILARVDSPPDLARERLAFQVSRLKDHMRTGEKDPLEGTARLVQEWYLCGAAPAADAVALERRFQRARTALEKTGRADEST